jgi:ribosomal protein L21
MVITRSGAVVAEFETSSREKTVTNGSRRYRKTLKRKSSHRNYLQF